MLIKYNKLSDYERDRVRHLENKGHIGYIRYLMMRRVPFADISEELIRLGLSAAEEADYFLYFEKVMLPVIQGYKLNFNYKKYASGKRTERLNFKDEFGRSETKRRSFVDCIKDMEIEEFFATEIVKFYGNPKDVPVNKDGTTIITTEKMPDWTELLNHPQRHIIDAMLVDGKTPKMISEALDTTHDVQLSPHAINAYGKAFFRTRRRDLERTIDDLQAEKDRLKEDLERVKESDDSTMTIGERSAALGSIKNRITRLDEQIKRLTSHHASASYNSSLLDYAGLREMFADVAVRTHRRYVTMDERTEDDVISNLSTLVGMLDKATKNVVGMDETMKENSKQSVADEMLEVVQPSMERLEEEEEQAREEFKEIFGDEEEDDDDILGLDEE